MTKIIFLGSLHDDPSGKNRLRHSVNNLIVQHKTIPEFIAFEWAHATHTALTLKRRELEQRLRSEFPILGHIFSARYADTLAYEGDLHEEVTAASRSVWMLDGDRNYDIQVSGNAEGFISKKITNLRQWLLPKIPDFFERSDEELLQATTAAYLEESKQESNRTELNVEVEKAIRSGRESYMFECIRKASPKTQKSNGIGIVIIGTAHLLDLTNTLFNLCSSAGYTTERIWAHEQ